MSMLYPTTLTAVTLLWVSMLVLVLVSSESCGKDGCGATRRELGCRGSGCDPGPGVNFGQDANDIRGPTEVVRFLQREGIKSIKLYHTKPETMKAFGGKGIELIIGISNEDIKSSGMAWNYIAADKWVMKNVIPYISNTPITSIAVGNEVTSVQDWDLVSQTEPAMRNIYSALKKSGLSERIKVSTPFGMDILEKTWPPSAGTFHVDYAWNIVLPVLDFLNETGSPFMINLYTFNSLRNNPKDVDLDAALLNTWAPISVDPNTGHVYKNLLLQLMDSTIAAMGRMGQPNVSLVVAETGWPSAGHSLATAEHAAIYNQNLVNLVVKNGGTPMRPKSRINAFIYGLFNENQRKGDEFQRHFGLYRPDLTPVYEIVWGGEGSLLGSYTSPALSSSSS